MVHEEHFVGSLLGSLAFVYIIRYTLEKAKHIRRDMIHDYLD
jgi:TRAP-type mannitol/chloroaromatic compound transport system permease small subunit